MIIAILVLAGGLRLINIAEHGLWWDEQMSVSSAVGSYLYWPIISAKQEFTEQDFWLGNTFYNVIEATILDGGNNLLYNILLHYWMRLWGISDLSVRVLSTIFGVGIVFLIYLITLSFCSRKIAYCASGLAAVHPFLIRYSQEARSYALATFLTLAATYVFINLMNLTNSRFAIARSWVLYSLLVSAALLSHYFTIYIFIGHAAYAVLTVRDRTLWLDLIKAALVAGVILGGWMYAGAYKSLTGVATVYQRYQQRAAHPGAEENWALLSTPQNLIAGGVQTVLAITGNYLQQAGLRLSRLAPLLVIPLILLIFCWRAYASRELSSSTLLLLGLLAGSGLIFSTILALRLGHIISFQPLYGNFATPYITILLAIGIAQVRGLNGLGRQAMMGVVLLYAAILFISIKLVYEDAPKHRPPNTYQIVAKQLANAALSGDVIVYPSWIEARLYNLYLRGRGTFSQRVDPTLQGNKVKIVRNNSIQLEITIAK